MPPRRFAGKKGPPSASPEKSHSHSRHRRNRRNTEEEEEDNANMSSVVNNVLSPLAAMANLNDATDDDGQQSRHSSRRREEMESAPTLFAAMPPFDSASESDGQSDDESGEEYSPSDEDEGEDIFFELLDDLEQEYPGEDEVEDEVEEMIADCNLELEDMDHDKENDNVDDDDDEEEEKQHVLKRVGAEAKDLFTVMKACDFKSNYEQRRLTSAEEMKKGLMGLMKNIVEFIVFTENLDISEYETAADLERKLNEKRGEIGEAMAEALRTKGHGDLDSKINLGSPFSIKTLILFYLHYAPEGCVAVVGDKRNFCRSNQCCIHTMFTKLYNFVVNEYEKGPDKMKEWTYGGKREEDVSNRMAAVDLIPFLLEKMDKDSEMRNQYCQVADYFGLESYLDLMIIPFCIAQLHIRLFEKAKLEANQGGELEERAQQLQLHFCGAASSLHILGLGKGMQKYREKLFIPSVKVTVGPHPQCWLMGLLKSRSIFSEEISMMIAEVIVSIYSCLYKFPQDFQSQITNIFGGGGGGSVNLPMYQQLAKKFRDAGLLQLDERVESDSSDDKEAVVKNILAGNGLGLVISSFIFGEMETVTLKRVMVRIRNCSAHHEYQQLAKKFRDAGLLQLDDLVESDSSDDKEAVVKNILALNGLSDDVSSFIIGQMETVSLKRVMVRIRNCSAYHECRQLAKTFRVKNLLQLDDLVESESSDDKEAVVKNILARNGLSNDMSSFFIGQMKNVTLKRVMVRIRKYSDVQERDSLQYELARKYYYIADNNGGEDSVAIRDDNDFEKFCRLARLEPDQAITKLVEKAKEYKNTFWDNVKSLQIYVESNPNDFEIIGDERILLIDESKEEWCSLNIWVKAMSGYSNAYCETENGYGMMAYKHMESVEQKSLADLGVCFTPKKFQEAMEQRTTRRLSERHDPSGLKSNIISGNFWEMMK